MIAGISPAPMALRQLTLPAILLLAACGSSPDPLEPPVPPGGVLEVRVEQSGLLLNRELSVVVNGGPPVRVPNIHQEEGGWLQRYVAVGTHDVELTGVATNCTVDGGSRVTAKVGRRDPVRIKYRVRCTGGSVLGGRAAAFPVPGDWSNSQLWLLGPDGTRRSAGIGMPTITRGPGSPEGAWDAASELIKQVHIIYKDRPFKTVLSNMPPMYDDIWVAGKEDWWFDVSDSDRIDLLPEKKRYEPGETAVFQVRMPFREATALVTVEREGIAEVFVRKLSGKSPVVELPIRPYYAPNVFVSVLCVRGRVAGVAPTPTVDLGKPAYKLGIAEINVGWKAHEVKVDVSPERGVYRTQEKAKVAIRARRAVGGALPKGSEAIVAVVDEGLLELAPNGATAAHSARTSLQPDRVTRPPPPRTSGAARAGSRRRPPRRARG